MFYDEGTIILVLTITICFGYFLQFLYNSLFVFVFFKSYREFYK